MIGDDLAAALPELREQAESLMRDSVLIERWTGTTTSPEPPFGDIDTYEPVYEGKARWLRPESWPTSTDAAGAQALVSAQELRLPVLASVGVEPGDRVTVTASENDPGRVGLTSMVWRDATQTQAVQRRLLCKDGDRPEAG